tara:strand:+ start:461 stop:946 length:486 start_codon:yes stop_codon:yes gene_type:complete
MKVKYLNPISVKGVLSDIGNYLYEILDMTDRELMYDRSKFDRQHLIDNWEAVQKKPDSFSQDLVYEGDAYSLALEIAQLILFRRKIRTHPNIKDSDDYGFPKGSVPRSFSFDTDWDKSSGKELKKKIGDFREDSWKDYFKAERVYNKLKSQKQNRLRRRYG